MRFQKIKPGPVVSLPDVCASEYRTLSSSSTIFVCVLPWFLPCLQCTKPLNLYGSPIQGLNILISGHVESYLESFPYLHYVMYCLCFFLAVQCPIFPSLYIFILPVFLLLTSLLSLRGRFLCSSYDALIG